MMKRLLQRILLVFGVLAVFVSGNTASSISAKAAVGQTYEYTYTITLFSGNQGKFISADGIRVISSNSDYSISGLEENNTKIRISGLKYGDRVIVNPFASMTKITDESKYYIRGLRESGRDNNTVGSSAFLVEGDQEYVVAYGIKGNMVSYTVNYQDAAGTTLLPSETYYGVAGDKPVIAFQYIDGYQPEAYNLTKTLQSDESKNIFTFVYNTVPQGQIVTPGIDNGAPGNGAANPAAGANGAAGNGAVVENPADNGAAVNGGNTEENQTPQEIKELDDEAVPLAANNRENSIEKAKPMILYGIVAAVSIGGLGFLIYILTKQKGKKVK